MEEKATFLFSDFSVSVEEHFGDGCYRYDGCGCYGPEDDEFFLG